jgi:hypothetical protein
MVMRYACQAEASRVKRGAPTEGQESGGEPAVISSQSIVFEAQDSS